jgi:B-block binding subunit of TFIIIC
VWKWLTRHPDVSVGDGRKGNRLSLSVVEAQYANKPTGSQLETVSGSIPGHDEMVNAAQEATTLGVAKPKMATGGKALKVYVSEERMWLAICGHPRDITKLFDMEFVLLSIIAAQGKAGILQGDLVRQSGQDKRSVPKRTDSLRDKGYIQKLAVHLKGLKTSRLILQKFVSENSTEIVTTVLNSTQGKGGNELIDFHALLKTLFAILKEKHMITREDLKKQLDMTTKWRARVLAKAIRKLEIIGCVRRVKAASDASKKIKLYFYCVKFIREPTERDLQAFFSPDTSLAAAQAGEEQENDEDEDDFRTASQPAIDTDNDHLEEIDRTVPQWNPDRVLANFLQDLIHGAEVQGLSNKVRVSCPRLL